MSDWDPELYNRFRAIRAEPVTMMLARLQLSPREQIVDWGCGSGEHTLELARRSVEGRVVGIDSSPAMIQRALSLRETLDPVLRRRLEFQLGDFRDFDADRTYSVVFSNAALQWVNDHRRLFNTAFRALRRRGRLAVQIPANENENAQATMRQMALEPAWSQWLEQVKTPSDENVQTATDYRGTLQELGFVDIDCFYHTFHHAMRNPGEVVEFCRSTSLRRFLDRLPAARHIQFTDELRERLGKSYGTNGPLILSFRRLFLFARRPDGPPPRNS